MRQGRLWWGVVLGGVMGILVSCGPGGAVPATAHVPNFGPLDGVTPTLTSTPLATASSSPTVTPTASATTTPTVTPTASATATPTAVPTATPTTVPPTATGTPTSIPTPTGTAATGPGTTPSPAPTSIATATALPTTTGTATSGFDLAIQKTAQCDTSWKCTFTIVVVNNGPGSANGVQVNDTISPAVPFTLTMFGGAGGTLCTVSGQTITCAPHYPLTLAPGGTYTLTIIVQMGTSTPFQNCASLPISDANLGNNQSCVNVTLPPPGSPTPPGAADLAVQKTGQCNWPYTCAFTITVTNVGSAPYTGSLIVADQTTPAWTTLLAGGGGNPSGPSCTFTGTAVACSVSSVTLAPGHSQTFTFNVYFGPTGYRQPFTNCASLPPSTDSNPANNQGCLTLQPPPTATPTP